MRIWFGSGMEKPGHLDRLFCNIFKVADDILSLPDANKEDQ